MADGLTLNAGSGGATLATDDAGAAGHVQLVKIAVSTDGSASPVTANGSGLKVIAAGNSGVDIGDVTINNAAGSPVPMQLSDGSTLQVLGTADLDSGAGTVTRVVVGIVVPGSGGPVTITGDAANGLDVDVTRIGGTVVVDGSGVTQPVSHAALTELAAAIDTEVQVDVVGPLPAGTNNIGDVDVASLPALPAGTNNIGDVDVASLPALAAGDNVVGRVKISDGTDVADVLDLTNANPLTVAIVDGSGDQITSFGGGAQYTEDAAAAANPVGTALNLIRADALAGLTTADGDNVAARGTDKGELYVKHADAIPVTDNGGALTVDGTVAVTHAALTELAAAIDTEMQVDVVAALPAGTNNIGDVDVLTVPADPFGANADAAVAAGAAGSIQAKLRRATQGLEDLKSLIVLAAGTNNIGDVDVLTVPADPFGANADAVVAAGAAGSIQAKLRRVTQGLEDLKTTIVLAAGSAAIGKLAANSGVDIGDVDVASIAAGTNVIGRVAAMPATGTMYNGATAVTPAFAIIDAATSGDNTLLAAQGAGNKIRVHALYLVAAGTVTARFESGAGGTALSGQMNLVANTGFVLPFNPAGWFETAANALLNLELSAAISVDGGFQYTVVT